MDSDTKKLNTVATTVIIIFMVLFGLGVALLAVEIGYRMVVAQSKPKTWSDRPVPYFWPEGAANLQDYPYAEPKPAGVFRIAVVGDSFTFAPYMQFDDAFPKRIERYLNLNREGQRAEVRNYGIPRYSTSHEVKTTQEALDHGADLVLLQITLNDPEIKLDWPTGLQLDTASGEVKLSHPIYRYWKSLAFVRTRIENSRSHREYRDYFFRLFNKKEEWSRFSSAMGTIVKMCKERNIPLVAVVFPLFGYVVDDAYPFYPIHQKVSGLLDSLEVKHLDITEAYRNIPLERLQVIPGVDRHPNEIAHRIAAERILPFLKESGHVPVQLFPKKSVDLRIGLFEVKK